MQRPNRVHALRLLIAWAVLSVIGVVIALQVHMPPGDQSRQGADESWIIQLMLILFTPIFIGVVLFIIYSALVFRQAPGRLEDGPASHGDARLQLTWVGITAIIVFLLAGLGIAELASASTATSFSSQPLGQVQPVGAASGHELQVQVIGQQWYFTYRYPDYGGVETLHLELPVNANIQLHITSTDILHSFWAYELGVKADANPGVDNVFYLTTMRAGSFTVRCAELCGLWHGNMFDTQGKVVSQEEFASWIKDQQASQADLKLPPYAPEYFPSPRIKGT